MCPVGELTFDQALEFLETALTFGINPSLNGIRALTAALDAPQDAFASMQVTGTNGKTSVTRITAALLSAHGERTGTYTSPHLDSYTERIAVDGVAVSEAEFAAAVSAVRGAALGLARHHAESLGLDPESLDSAHTEFELLTAAALWHFRQAACTWASLEVGMGGRWDATSIVSPRVAVVTGVALDHTERLGVTREEIAADKAHIIKPGSIAVLGPGCSGLDDIFANRLNETGADVVRVGLAEDDVAWRVTAVPDAPGGWTWLDVYGLFDTYDGLAVRAPAYQAPNVATAIAAVEAALGRALSADAVRAVLHESTFPGRFELVRREPAVVIDGAHNPQAADVLAEAITDAFGARKPVVVLGILRDKDAEGIVRALAPVSSAIICTRNASSRCLDPEDLARVVEGITGIRPPVSPDVTSAIDLAVELASATSTGVVVTGSLYTAGEARVSAE